MAEFHFIRPFWLIVFPFGVWLIWKITGGGGSLGRWQAFVDKALQPYVLTSFDSGLSQYRWLAGGALAAWLLATLALAGPTWERLPVPAFRSEEALVIALDLSRSMDAGDIEPSRLERAKLKLLSLLERRDTGQTGLVVFSAHAFTVTPLTSDTQTISALVSSLSSDIMPSRGSYPEVGVSRAVQLMRHTGINRGEILLVTDSEVSPGMMDLAREIQIDGLKLHVLAVGTAEGSPIAQRGGGFLSDNTGQVVVTRVNSVALQRLADLGGGRFANLTPDDRDLDYLFSDTPTVRDGVLSEPGEFQTDVWRDQGPWLVLLLLPFVAAAFRRGWVLILFFAILLPIPQAHALTWTDLWKRPDQQGEAAFQAEEHERASELFRDPEWRAVAQYRAGDYEASAETLGGIETPDAHYNRGNSLARRGSIPEAIQAYERALELDPNHEDAWFNRDLLLQQPPQDSESQSGDQGQDSEQNLSDESSQSDSQGDSQESQQGVEPQNAQASEPEDPQATGQVAESDPEGTPAEDTPMPSPGELEEWASEQAAEQWLRRIPEDPGGLLRRKFLYQYQRLGIDQDGNYVWPGDEAQPW